MASVTCRNGRRAVQFVALDGKRCTLSLGKVPQRAAEQFAGFLDRLIASRKAALPLDGPTASWLAGLPAATRKRLAAAGLIEAPGDERPAVTLSDFLADFVVRRIDVKPATKEIWSQVVRNLTEHFGSDRRIDAITPADADDFKVFLLQQKLAPTTVQKRLQFARTFFTAARKRGLVAANPFAEVSANAALPPDRLRFVTREETARLLAVADPTWRTIIALSRFAGLRCPSEVLSLRWQDVDWDAARIVVQSPKTEHHPGRATRTIPLFAELRPFLEEAFELAPAGAVYVVDARYRDSANTPSGWRNCNLRQQFARLIRRAGLQPWPRLFHALRSSRETELAATFPLHVATAWLGNTPRIALKHYLQVTAADFDRAAGLPDDAAARCNSAAPHTRSKAHR